MESAFYCWLSYCHLSTLKGIAQSYLPPANLALKYNEVCQPKTQCLQSCVLFWSKLCCCVSCIFMLGRCPRGVAWTSIIPIHLSMDLWVPTRSFWAGSRLAILHTYYTIYLDTQHYIVYQIMTPVIHRSSSCSTKFYNFCFKLCLSQSDCYEYSFVHRSSFACQLLYWCLHR